MDTLNLPLTSLNVMPPPDVDRFIFPETSSMLIPPPLVSTFVLKFLGTVISILSLIPFENQSDKPMFSFLQLLQLHHRHS